MALGRFTGMRAIDGMTLTPVFFASIAQMWEMHDNE